MENICKYYQAHIQKERVLSVVAILKSFDHLCFDRSIDPSRSLFEFFVPASHEATFLKLMEQFTHEGTVSDLRELSNRLLQPSERL